MKKLFNKLSGLNSLPPFTKKYNFTYVKNDSTYEL